jgi:hypothetical protein
MFLGVLEKGTGGEGEIRTRGTLSSTSAFEAGAFNHSATSPLANSFVFEQSGRRRIHAAILSLLANVRRWQ